MKHNLIIALLSTTLLLSGCSSKEKEVSVTNEAVLANAEVIPPKETKTDTEDKKTNVEDNNTKSTDKEKKEEKKDSETPKEIIPPKEIKLPEVNIADLSKAEKGWFYQPKKDGTPSGEPQEVLDLINKYSAYYLGDTSQKEIYLTFDEGYENGYTAPILDVLKKHNVKAAFFVVKPYITSSPDLVKRMVDEGHLVCNHSVNHPSMASIQDKDKFIEEFTGVEKAFEEVTGKKMSKYFRPPMGKYSELSLYYTASLGYKSIFWSFAYDDWDPKKQPSHDYGKKLIAERTHNGAIVLLHAVSKTNAEILDEVLTTWKEKGFVFKTLDELP